MKRIYIFAIIAALILFGTRPISSAGEIPYYASSGNQPNILIILDRSGSMNENPAGSTLNITPCPAAAYPNPLLTTGNYSKKCIARQVLFDVLDADDSNGVTSPDDDKNLGARLGYMRYYNGVIQRTQDVGTPYATIWGSAATADASTLDASGNTPLGQSLDSALAYLTSSAITGDACYSAGCRKNYVIVITDGADTATCTTTTARNRSVVYAAKALYGARIPVFVIGFGSLPSDLKNNLNWAAYYGYGGTNSQPSSVNYPNDPNPYEANSGTGTFSPGSQLCDDVSTNPGEQALSGYAFLAANATDLSKAIKHAIDTAKEGSYTRSQPVLTASGSKIYSGFFDLPGWKGHLDAWPVTTTGNIDFTTPSNNPCTSYDNPNTTANEALHELYDAGRTLTYSGCTGYVASADRNIYTAVGSPLSRISFKVSGTNTSAQQIDLCTTLNISGFDCANNYAAADTTAINDNNPNELINFIRFASTYFNGSQGTRDASTPTWWKLGDIWHSTPTIVGPPQGTFNSTGYKDFKSYYSNRTQLLIVGANDGMLHAFDDTNKGREAWAFIPNNLLDNLKNLNAGHALFVDSSPTAADVCLNTATCGKSTESASDWKTILLSGERDGGNAYFALDITNTTNPPFLWQFTDIDSASCPAANNYNCLGNTWSKPVIGKVKYYDGANIVDKWVAFFGGGYSTTDNVGNRFYAIDITPTSGVLLRRFTIGSTTNKVPGTPRAVDLNGDYYVDAVFFGDTEGKLSMLDLTNTDPSNWSVNTLFDPAASHNAISCPDLTTTPHSGHTSRGIYYAPAVAYDDDFNLYTAFGTGYVDDYTDPTGSTTTDYFYMLKIGKTIVTEIFRKEFSNGERIVAAPVVYGGYMWYVTYLPPAASACCDAGKSYLRWVEIAACGASGFAEIGNGIAQGPVFVNGKPYTNTSNKPTPDNPCDKTGANCPKPKGAGADVIYWRER